MKAPLLTATQEIDLAKRIERGDLKAKERFIEANIRLVGKIATDYKTSTSISRDEIVQFGSIGLIRAVERFDWRKGIRFSVFARTYIHGEIRAGMRKDGLIFIPEQQTRTKSRAIRAEQTLRARLQRPPTDEEIATEAKISLRQLETVRTLPYSTALPGSHSLDDAVEVTGQLLSGEGLDPVQQAMEEDAEREVWQKRGALILSALPTDERAVISLRFGAGGGKPHTVAEISDQLNMPADEVRRIEARALRRMEFRLAQAQETREAS